MIYRFCKYSLLVMMGMKAKLWFGLLFSCAMMLAYLFTKTDYLTVRVHLEPVLSGSFKQLLVQKEKPGATANGAVCEETVQWHQQRETTTSLEDWTYQTTTKCPEFSLHMLPKTHPKVVLECTGDKPKLVKIWSNSPQDIFSVKPEDDCLTRFIDSCCTGNDSVPNVIHYIWYSDKEMTYFFFLSFMSALRFVKPCLFVIHGDQLPRGRYWDHCVSQAPNIIHVKRNRTMRIFNQDVPYFEFSSEVMRIEALRDYGGIYLDYDQLVLRPLKPLRKFQYVMGHERLLDQLGCQLMMAEKGAKFLDLWYDGFRTDLRTRWAYNCLTTPWKIAEAYPKLIHIEGFNFTRPTYKQADELIFKSNYDWSTNYAMHMFARVFKGNISVDVIRRMNTTLGAVSRHILIGNKEICEN